MTFLAFLTSTAKTLFEKQVARMILCAVLFLLRISEVVYLRWKYVVNISIAGIRCVRIILVKAKNKKEWMRAQVTQLPQLDNELCPVALMNMQKDYSRRSNNRVFIDRNGESFSTKCNKFSQI